MRCSPDDNWFNCPIQRTPFIFGRIDQLVIKNYFLVHANFSLRPLLLSLPLMIMSSFSLKQYLVCCYLYVLNIPLSAFVIRDCHCCSKPSEWGSIGGNLHTRVHESNLWQLKKKAHHQIVLNKALGIYTCRDSKRTTVCIDMALVFLPTKLKAPLQI